jgi:peptide deformylase
MKILSINNPSELATLQSKSVPVADVKAYAPVCAKLKAFVEDKKNGAVGLAAVQIAVPVRIFAARFPAGNGFRERTVVFANPEIIEMGALCETKKEKCLSEPGIERYVARAYFATIKYQDEKGREHTSKASGWVARIIQHEMDHLDGVLLIDRVEVKKKW